MRIAGLQLLSIQSRCMTLLQRGGTFGECVAAAGVDFSGVPCDFCACAALPLRGAAVATAAFDDAAAVASSLAAGAAAAAVSGGLAELFHPFSRPARFASCARRTSPLLSLNAASMLSTV